MHTPSGRLISLPSSQFLPTDYINAALRSGFVIQSRAETGWPELEGGHGGPTAQTWCPEAGQAAYVGTPALIIVELAWSGPTITATQRLR
jgi:hypothetical protein